MTITVPLTPLDVQLIATSEHAPVIVRAHARRAPRPAYTAAMRDEDRLERIRERCARVNAAYDDMLSALDRATAQGIPLGIVFTQHRSRIVGAAGF